MFPININHKTLNKAGRVRMYLNTVKAVHDKPRANIVHNSAKLKASPLRSGIKQGCPPLPLLFNLILEDLDRAISQDKK